MTAPGDTHAAELAAGRDGALAAVARAADEWDAHWRPEGEDGGRLVLPRVAGLHRGIVIGRLHLYPGEGTVEGTGEGAGGGAGEAATRAVYEVDAVDDHVHASAVGVLAIAAVGALLTVVWPIFPSLLPLAPLGALLALGGWFLVVSRLQNAGPEEFLRRVGELAADPPTDLPTDPPADEPTSPELVEGWGRHENRGDLP